jgi:uncharacterized protein
MSKTTFDFARLDVALLAQQAAVLEAQWPVVDLPRLAEMAHPQPVGDWPVRVRIQGETVPVTGSEDEIWLHLHVDARLPLTCQRCLGLVEEHLLLERSLRFVADEATAAALDDELEDDVLALQPAPNLRELVEDELILALPLVPRHEICPKALPRPDQAGEEVVEAPHPFAVLAQLKQGKSGS